MPGVEATAEPLDLGWSLAALLGAYVRRGNDVFADLPGGPRGYQVLQSVLRGDLPSQIELGRRVGLDRTVVTYLLDDMEAEGLVQRRVDDVDRRVRRVVPTAKGRRLLPKLDRRLAMIEQEVLGGLSDADASRLRALLRRATAGLDDPEEAADPAVLVRRISGEQVPHR